MSPYKALTQEQKTFHIFNMTSSGFLDNGQVITSSVSGLLPSGEANFYDIEQIPKDAKFYYNGQQTANLKKGSQPLSFELTTPPFLPFVIGVSGLKDSIYASGDLKISYMSNIPNPSGGTGEITKVPYGVGFQPSGITINPNGSFKDRYKVVTTTPFPKATTTTTTTTTNAP